MLGIHLWRVSFTFASCDGGAGGVEESRHTFKLLCCVGVVLVLVGVVLQGRLAVGLLDLILSSTRLDA